MFKNYFKTGIRNLQRNKVYSFINIAGLSLGLACAMLIMLYVNDEVSYDRFHKNADHIYRIDRKLVRDNGNVDNSGYTGLFQGPRFTAGIPEIQGFVRFRNGQKDIKKAQVFNYRKYFILIQISFQYFLFPY